MVPTPVRRIDPGACAVPPTSVTLEGVCVWERPKAQFPVSVCSFWESAQTIDRAEGVNCEIISGSPKRFNSRRLSMFCRILYFHLGFSYFFWVIIYLVVAY